MLWHPLKERLTESSMPPTTIKRGPLTGDNAHVIKKVFSNNSDFRSSSDRASLAASHDTWLETAQTSNEASSHNSPLLAAQTASSDWFGNKHRNDEPVGTKKPAPGKTCPRENPPGKHSFSRPGQYSESGQ
ncbi:hypothetical protein DPMN_163777 [Dreissena polymorpha]|uniref:Uncharacterized protein n=1 Tax=Dreissena polymorpha TaxID=45954 RepID=A0A9D4EUL0_DREPO|nr:hypothetical protein DPMN_163777 [Dreissena polymorpha]